MNKTLRGFESTLAFLPKELFTLLERFHEQGHSLFLCGGSVRDLLLGGFPTDWDLASSASPEEILAFLPHNWIHQGSRGQEWGSFLLRLGELSLELTSFRSEGNYRDHRHPNEVWFHRELDRDWQRRDFTVNALYMDLSNGLLVDPCGGVEDLRAKRLKTIGKPCARFSEDPLRILRGIRFSSEIDLVPEGETWQSLCDHADHTLELSGSRVGKELQAIVLGKGRARGLRLLWNSGVLAALLPELQALEEVPQPPMFHPEGPVLLHTECVLANLPEPVSPALAWAALLHDIGKKQCFSRGEDRIRFHGHDMVSAEQARKILGRLSIPKSVQDACCSLIEEHIRIASFPEWREKRKVTFLRDPLFLEHLSLHKADCLGSHRLLGIYEVLLQQWRQIPPLPPQPLLSAQHLIQKGWKPGPLFRELFDEIEALRAEGRIQNREDALLFADEFMRMRKGCR